jgi:hypothetical protein
MRRYIPDDQGIMKISRNDKPKKRQLIYLPEVNPDTFLLFFEKGDRGSSWSLRDYSRPGRVETRYAQDFGWSAEEVRNKAVQSSDAPVIRTSNLDFWHQTVIAENRRLGRATAGCQSIVAGESDTGFPLLDRRDLMKLPKARKIGDMKRIQKSVNSEDWVTWNFFRLMLRAQPNDWWTTLEERAARFNPEARLRIVGADKPELAFWRRIAAPRSTSASTGKK